MSLSRGRVVAVLAGLVGLSWYAFHDVGTFAFLAWDDPIYIRDNANVRAGLSWANVWWALTTTHDPYWHPLTWLSHMLDVTLFGTVASGPHLVNLGLHCVNVALLFVALHAATRAAGRSAFVAAIFAVHPAHVESVAWVAERKDVLSTTLVLLCLLAWGRWARAQRTRDYAIALALFAAAAMTKPMVVTLPVMLLLVDVWPLGRNELRVGHGVAPLLKEKIPFFAIAAGLAAITMMVQSRIGAMADLDALPVGHRLANAVTGIVTYLQITLWPLGLAAFYPQQAVNPAYVAGCALLLLALTAGAAVLRRRHPYVLAGWGWFVVGLAPVIGVLQAGEQAAADRFLYLPIAGPLVILSWGAAHLLSRARFPRIVVAACGAGVVVACLSITRVVVPSWANDISLWTRAASVVPNNYRAYENLGRAYRESGNHRDAWTSFERALAAMPEHSPRFEAVVRSGMGVVAVRQGAMDVAARQFADAVRLDPNLAEAHVNLAGILAAQGNLDGAEREFRGGIALAPMVAAPYVGLGNVLLGKQQPQEALGSYDRAIEIDARLAEAHNGRCAALITLGDLPRAQSACEEALRLPPALASAHLNLGIIALQRGDTNTARQHLIDALRIDPAQPQARRILDSLR